MTLPSPSTDRILNIYLTLTQYPILASRIRARMREMLLARGIIHAEEFEAEVRKKAIESQIREGLHDPYSEEPFDLWELRLERVRDALTDFYFAYNLLYEDFESLVRQTVGERGEVPNMIYFNPELAPQDMLFEQAELIERLPPEKRKMLDARLQEIKVVLIRTMISDQLGYIKIARKWFTIDDLNEIRKRKIGYGKIGGKSAGMLLAYRILRETASPALRAALRIPVSYFLASDVFYSFMAANGLVHWSDQKYKPEAQMRAEYPIIQQEFRQGRFPEEIAERLRAIIREADGRPLIVRSSSLLEDNFGTSFAGKYESFFCPNQGTEKENLRDLTRAITQVYASGLNPNALLYRHHKGLVDYDERLAVLIQFVEGERMGKYFLPQGAGVGFSRNLYRWSPQIRREDGFLRLVWGLGTRAVEAVANDHPRLVALSHPLLHPASSVELISRYSQKFVDVLDLEANALRTVPLQDILDPRYPALRYIAQIDEGGYLSTIRTSTVDTRYVVVTFDEMLRRTPFAPLMREMLKLLETHYQAPVDTEFTVRVPDPYSVQPGIEITLLQCRPQSHISPEDRTQIPEDLPESEIVFSTRRMVPHGVIQGIRYVLFVTPEGYFHLPSAADRVRLERAIGQLNLALKDRNFICVGPGRWGTSTPDLGVHVAYGDIYNTRALVELSGREIGTSPEPSFGTHFFQDLMEAHIYPLAIYTDDADVIFNREFFYTTPNRLADWYPNPDETLVNTLRLIDVQDYRPGALLEIIMDDEEGRAVGYLKKNV
ncbi:MAG: hypothetical protein N2117_02420 [Anaerolineales bacterium]|nr:hypothetical protein [Anaerolineales bacterium]MCX7754087.1 hypothetical protein [Anaerolineales bacterium]MDW8278830.1 PEP/pyruvate-binding domain-containing protein [Anaerolineales bacterium]